MFNTHKNLHSYRTNEEIRAEDFRRFVPIIPRPIFTKVCSSPIGDKNGTHHCFGAWPTYNVLSRSHDNRALLRTGKPQYTWLWVVVPSLLDYCAGMVRDTCERLAADIEMWRLQDHQRR